MLRFHFVLLMLPLALVARTWHFEDGKTLEADLVSYKNGTVILKADSGSRGLYSITKFTEADQATIRKAFPDGDRKPTQPKKHAAPPSAKLPTPSPSRPNTPPLTGAQINRLPANKQPPHPGLKNRDIGQHPLPITWRIPATMEHQDVVLDKYNGKMLIVQFWAAAIPNSVKEMNSLASIYPNLKQYGVEVVGVNIDTKRSIMQRYEKQAGKLWRNYFDPKRKTIDTWGVTALPTNVLIDQNGIIVAEHIPISQLQTTLRDYLDRKKMVP